MWMYFQRVLIPHQQNEAVREEKPRGNLSDLYPRWLGTREFLLHGRDPYGEDVTRDIQIGYYGRQLDPKRPYDPKDQQAFAYPFYITLLLAPTVKVPFWLAQRAFFLILTLLTGFSVLLWLDVLHWKLSFDAKVAWLLLTLSCLPTVQGLKLQQLTLLVAALTTLCITAISRDRLGWAGLLLALATIKPQLVFLIAAWLCIWVSGNWYARRRLLLSFGITMALLVGISEAMLPGWIQEFRAAMVSYYHYTGGGNSLLDVVFTPMVGRIISIALVGILFVSLWKLRTFVASTPEFAYALSLTLATTLLVIPMFAPYNQILLLPAVMMLMRCGAGGRQIGYISEFFVLVMKLSVFWPFLSAVLLIIALPFLPSLIIVKAAGLPFYSTLAIPISVYATLLILKSQLISGEMRSASLESRTLQANVASE